MLGIPLQKLPDSIVQKELQPSPLIKLLSSQSYAPKTSPSPQIALQGEATARQINPG